MGASPWLVLPQIRHQSEQSKDEAFLPLFVGWELNPTKSHNSANAVEFIKKVVHFPAVADDAITPT
jgi:hypothetical protein